MPAITELLAAFADPGVRHVVVGADLAEVPAVRLLPGRRLSGTDPPPTIRFAAGQDGILLSADNEVERLQLIADPGRRALFNDTTVESLGRLVLLDLHVTGLVQLLARDRVRGGHVEAHGIGIAAADARGCEERPNGYGVEVVPGVFTLWNQQADLTRSL